MNETRLSPLAITLLGRYPLSVIASFLTEVEGTRFFLTRKEWTKRLLPLFRLPLSVNPNHNGDNTKRCKYVYRHRFVVVPVQDATTRLARLNTRRWKQRKLRCCGISTEDFFKASLSSADVAQKQERAPTLGYPPILRFLNPSMLKSQTKSPFRPGTTLLASYPRSGNTLLRSLLESITGYVTGSDTRPDRPLSLALAEGHDLVGEGLTQPSQTAIVKTHWPERIGFRKYYAHRAIILVRNPFDAIDSYWNLNVTNTHTEKVTDQVYQEHANFFTQLALNEIKVWMNFLEFWDSQSAPLLWVRYEDLIQDPCTQLLRILEFSTSKNQFYWYDRVQLVLQQQQGHGYRSRNPRTQQTPPNAQCPSREKKSPFGRSLQRYSHELLHQMHDLDDHGWLLKLGYHVFLQDFPSNVIGGEFPPLSYPSSFESDALNTAKPGLAVNYPVEHELRPPHCSFGRNMRDWRRKHTHDDKQPFPTAIVEATNQNHQQVDSHVLPWYQLVQFTLKVRAGSAATAPTYKRKVARFTSGTPAEWIAVLEALDKIFAQNSITTAQDRENVIRTILRGDSWTAFESSSIEESRVNLENMAEPLALNVNMVDIALKAVSFDVFPHKAIINQVAWMKRRMRKPATMSVRQFVASVTQMNSKLSRFPGVTDEQLFTPPKLIELLEFALPEAWRAKFDLAGYIPTDHDKTRLVLEGEQIERAAALSKTAAIKPKQHSNAAGKTGSKWNCTKRRHSCN